MTITKIEEITLYVSEAATDNAADHILATAFMDHSGISYQQLRYNDIGQFDEFLLSINSWWQNDPNAIPITELPFLTYVEVHDDILARQSPIRNLQGLDQIKTIIDIIV